MPETWERALEKYRYPVNLSKFKDAAKYPGWFEEDICPGNWSQTREFEDRFREHAQHAPEAWYEVVYWKLYSGAYKNKSTRAAIRVIQSELATNNLTVENLWNLCKFYMNGTDEGFSNQDRFKMFRPRLVSSKGIAVAATFPAFIDPQRFPMVDRHVATWARENAPQHSYEQHGGPSLLTYEGLGESPLTDDDWGFVESWIEWCRFNADRLTERSDRKWRARDVEMAVFTVQRDKTGLLRLNSL